MDDTTPPDSQPTPPPTEPEVAATTTEPTPAPTEEAQPGVIETVPPEPETTPPTETPQAVPEATPVESVPPPVAAPALTLEEMLSRLSPTELKALFKKYLLQIGAKGREKSRAQLEEKKQQIIAHVGIHGRITHKEAMQLTHSAKTTATRMLQSLEKEGKLVQHGGYKDHAAYYTLRL